MVPSASSSGFSDAVRLAVSQLRGQPKGGRAGRIAALQAADSDRDGRLTGKDAVAFFERSGLPKSELAKVWAYSDSARKGYLDQTTFYKVSAGLRTSHGGTLGG